MEIASGEIGLFLDDDVELEPSFIEELLRAYAPGVIGVSGIITNYSKPNIFQHMWESLFLRGVFHDDRQSLYRNAERLVNSPPVKVRQFGGGLMSFRASAIRNLRWDANLTGACPGDDVDFCARLPKGSALIISTNARLVHKRSPSPAGGDSDHWLLLHAQVANYMRQRHWRKGLWNSMFRLAERRLCYCWGGSMSESQIDGTLAQMVDWGVERQATRDETTMNTYRRVWPEMQLLRQQSLSRS